MAHRILVIRFGSLGDVILTSAAILNLKLAYPDSRLTVLTKSRFASLVGRFTGVDEVVSLPEPASARALLELLVQLDKHRYDLIVDLHGNIRSWLTRKLTTAGASVSYPKRRFERWLTVRRWYRPGEVPHTIDLYNAALSELNIAACVHRPVLTLGGLPSGEQSKIPADSVVVAPGAAHPTKQWPRDRFLAVALTLIEKTGSHILWTALSEDRLTDAERASLPPGTYTELIGLSFEQLAAALSRARLVVSNDSGLMHLASAVGTPVVAIFGPTHPSLGFSPRGQFDQIVQVDEYCRPCSLHGKAPCFRSEQFCFTRVSVDMVTDAAMSVLARPMHKALLLDRDGTLMVDKHYLADPDQVELIPGAAAALRAARDAGYRLVVLSNQSGVARGYFPLSVVEAVHQRLAQLLAAEGVTLDTVEFCPHYASGTVKEFSTACDCRKPHPGMAERAAQKLGLNLRQSVVIGDKPDDLNLALGIGAHAMLVRTGHGKDTEAAVRNLALYKGIEVHDSVADAVPCLRIHGSRDQTSSVLP